MPSYVVLINWTDQGVRTYRDTVHRANSLRKTLEKVGAQVRERLWTLGEYDFVTVLDAPDDETVAAVMLQLAEFGNVRTKILRAFDADQMTAIIDRTS